MPGSTDGRRERKDVSWKPEEVRGEQRATCREEEARLSGVHAKPASQEGASRDEPVTRAAKDAEEGYTDMDVGMEVCSIAREHRKQGRNKGRVMWSHKDLRANAYSKDNNDTWVEPMGGKRGTERGCTPRCLGRGGRRAEGGTHMTRYARGGIRRAIGVTGSASGGHTQRTKEE